MIEMNNENKEEIFLDVLNFIDCQTVREWRNKNIETLRTSFLITDKMQENFYDKIVNDRNSKHRYFGIYKNYVHEIEDENEEETLKCDCKILIGMGGIINIEWENGLAEISLIIGDEFTGQGYGKQSVKLLLDKAFCEMRLNNVYGECYECNKNIEFWKKIIKYYDCYHTILPNRKFFKNKYYNSLYFSISCLNNYIGRQEEK